MNNHYGFQYLVVPKPRDNHWQYLPLEYKPEAFQGSHLLQLRDARLYQFGILSSAMHMAWIQFAYGKSPMFISYPWPIGASEVQLKTIEAKAQKILDLRMKYLHMSIADLYDPYTMPDELLTAHGELDLVVDAAYRKQTFGSYDERIDFLLTLHDRISMMWEFEPEEAIHYFTTVSHLDSAII